MNTYNAINNNRSPATSANINLLYGKRAPNGFLGVRGKRPFTTGEYDEVLYK